jgi:hypothetical protein
MSDAMFHGLTSALAKAALHDASSGSFGGISADADPKRGGIATLFDGACCGFVPPRASRTGYSVSFDDRTSHRIRRPDRHTRPTGPRRCAPPACLPFRFTTRKAASPCRSLPMRGPASEAAR